ncbi:MAG: hypothetical protein ACKVQT_23535 [Burkholderiales bacterium]
MAEAARHTLAASTDPIQFCYDQGWTDGLPVIPPTEERVSAMLAGTPLAPSTLIAKVAPSWAKATVEKIAVNAVMAGCLPAYMPVIIAAVRAMTNPALNLNGMQCSTHLSTPLVVVNGPARIELGMNSGANVFGQGNRANATIGRAIKLILTNIGRAIPGVTDKATLGHPGKYTYCIAENEEQSPWDPLHVERGLKREQSAVTVFGCEAPHNVNNQASQNAHDLAYTIADTMATLGKNMFYAQGEVMLVVCPSHAETIANDGWSKQHLKEFLYEKARKPVRLVKLGGLYGREVKRNFWPRWVNRDDENEMVPLVRRPSEITIVVAGGAGRHSAFLPGWATPSVTVPVE